MPDASPARDSGRLLRNHFLLYLGLGKAEGKGQRGRPKKLEDFSLSSVVYLAQHKVIDLGHITESFSSTFSSIK